MIPLITEEVIKNGWVESTDVLIDFIAISQSTPGAFAINIATFIGYNQAGILGAIFTTLGVVLPSFFIILFIAIAFHKFKTNKYVIGFLNGISPVNISYRTTPNDQMSVLLSTSSPFACSGEM